ncbi:NAD-dependent epimerase/dehydratase family protein [Nocardioides mangrovicus]|uniref:NAD-dependent epimerase/dehydratase family protein n=1 Tax=Nocardioides mangrovicus TaxID=2478913 RepID=A0A3L8P0X3_9ACTN|nr:NAD-dependent epimerase/dehydratase family protein [Nocardioides mangrovicus]RLV48671.1 NAD-dependent epimerase/dehydratase family protein [Nocardioides mangrovicus]
MRVLLTGGTGLIGSATLQALRDSGHEVIAAVRSDSSAQTVAAGGATPLVGDITDVAWLTEQLRGVDGAVHLAADNRGPAMDEAVTDAVIAAFDGTDKPYVHTGGVWVWGSGSDLSEDDPQNPPAITAWRSGPETKILQSGVKASLVAPGIVYGAGGEGIPRMLVDGPRDESGALTLIGTGEQHWTTVAASDLGELYVLALERSSGGTYIGASGQNPTVRELGEAAADSVVAGSADEARERLGEGFGDALLLDQQASGAKARSELGWEPNARSLVEELRG